MTLSLLYRGSLSSCNYACGYCPFAKKGDDRTTLEADRHALARFVSWASTWTKDTLGIFFTPWGEALVRSWYRDAIAELSKQAHVERVAIQTNLSAPLAFLDRCDVSRVALWCTYHPTEVALERFVSRCLDVVRRRVRFSVGVVGLREHLEAIEALRSALPPEIYLWVNAARQVRPRYSPDEIARLQMVDPHFRLSVAPPPSRGAPCRTGKSVLSVDGSGDLRRCHFVERVIGNLYVGGWEDDLEARPCPRPACTCHIGYVHRDDLGLYETFAGGVLERIPANMSFDMPRRHLAIVGSTPNV
jgi:hypothetical protein